MFMRRLAIFTLAAAMCLISARQATAADPYDVDVVLPITGTFAFVGTTHQNELQVLEGIVNKQGGIQGRPGAFRLSRRHEQSGDVASDPQRRSWRSSRPSCWARRSARCVRQRRRSTSTNGPVNYCFSPVIPTTKGSYVFSASVSGRDLILATMRYFHGKGWKKIATLNTTDASGQIGDRDIASVMAEPEFKDMTLLTAEHFSAADTSVTAQVSKIKALNPAGDHHLGAGYGVRHGAARGQRSSASTFRSRRPAPT